MVLWCFLSIFDVNECIGCQFSVKSLFLTSIDVNFGVKWSKKCHFVNFLDIDDHSNTFWWFLWWFLLIFVVNVSIGWTYFGKELLFDVNWHEMIEKCNFANFDIWMTIVPLFDGFLVFFIGKKIIIIRLNFE